ncbi:MAG: hypothetical protein HGA49_03755 [Eubacteriaceae bacterium]|nr:hypothetical protein [Eubacteriaceae bacterium]
MKSPKYDHIISEEEKVLLYDDLKRILTREKRRIEDQICDFKLDILDNDLLFLINEEKDRSKIEMIPQEIKRLCKKINEKNQVIIEINEKLEIIHHQKEKLKHLSSCNEDTSV